MDVKVEDGTAVVACGDTLVALYVDLILPSSNPPDSTLRATMQADLRRLGPKLRKLVAVPLGNGLWLSIVRTIVRSTLIISGQAKQQTVVATVDECLDCVRALATPATPSSATLRGAINTLFVRLGVKQSDAA